MLVCALVVNPSGHKPSDVAQGKAASPSTSSFAIEHPPGNGHAGPSGNGGSGSAQMQSARTDSGDQTLLEEWVEFGH